MARPAAPFLLSPSDADVLQGWLRIGSIWLVASKRIRSSKLLVVYLKVELGCACVFQ